MPNKATCQICVHADRRLIDEKLSQGGGTAMLAGLFDVNERALLDHKARHLQGLAVLAAGVTPEQLIEDLQNLGALLTLKINQENVSSREFSVLVARKHDNIALLAKLTGAEKRPSPVEMIPLWGKVRAALTKALADYPKAREAVDEELMLIEAEISK